MSRGSRQIPSNPFIKPESAYACSVADCKAIGVWSPVTGAGHWYCRFHAGLSEPQPRWEPPSGPFTAEQIAQARAALRAFVDAGGMFSPPSDTWWQCLITRWRSREKLRLAQREMARRAWVNAHKPADWIPPDAEADAERLAIQAESSPL